ncbi:RagB/SusD family nutrient uptake outer membrane protein [Membranicola marinus]|uniref:RagB/SusD family nutrient uptake outer membrane protein n=1 Tax=Membranihabitans marinus TaxID=1227546 RepID=A0A953L980_9BACT|nr:RagB/SusD family nutrient uptake outer membrane protein [Membranihabitans marinus]MBY5957343.1 RagB/SusD family nutrient uptake outer membrane protein [Membranihabitans marinus]
MKYILLFIFSLTLFMACEETLKEVPKDFISKNNYYKNQADAEGAIAGVYSSFASDYGITFWLFSVLHGDYANGRGSQATITVFDQILDQTNINRAGSIWSSFYRTINRANSVLDNVPAIEDINPDVKARILSEAHFFRALSYFNLVRGFGDVPLKTSESVDISDIASPRVSQDQVYDLILSDALEAEKNLPESVGDNTGQLSVWAAKMLLAEVYLTLEKWDDAARVSKDVMDNSPYQLTPVTEADDYYNTFANFANTEYILAVNHSASRQSSIPSYLHRPNTPPYNYSSGGVFAWLPNLNSFIGDEWDDNDLRKEFNLYREYLGPDGEMVSLPSSSPVLFKKFITGTDGLRLYSDPIFRITEAYLIFAEAAAMANNGPTVDAVEALNAIKRRAYGYEMFSSSPVDYSANMTATEFQNAVLQEKAYEFIVEGKRWWDLKRTGKVKEALAAAGKDFIDERFLWPIDEDEINNNPDITAQDQNPGY